MTKHLQVYNLLYPKGFLKKYWCNICKVQFVRKLQFDNDSLKSSCSVVAVVCSRWAQFKYFRCNTSGRCCFFRFIVLISLSISNTLIVSNLKDFSFPFLFLISNIHGWISYFLIALSTGSKIVLDSLLTIYEFSYIFKVDTAFLKKVFSVSATLSREFITLQSLVRNINGNGNRVLYSSLDADFWCPLPLQPL